jgi:transposase InsO family protein
LVQPPRAVVAVVDHNGAGVLRREMLEDALARHGKPDIFNTNQGSQFMGAAFTGVLTNNGIAISMDGKGAWRDNVFVERLDCGLELPLSRIFAYLEEPLVDYRDEPTTSFRANTKEWVQRESVMLDYYSWARRVPLSRDRPTAIRKLARRAMRKHGRSIMSRIYLGFGAR